MKTIIYCISLLVLGMFGTSAFAATDTLPSCISKQFSNSPIATDRIKLKAPEIAENGSVVGVEVEKIIGLKQDSFVKEIHLYNEFREEPIATFFLSPQVKNSQLKTRVRLRESTNVYAVAKLDNGEVIGGKSYVKVTIGGCGGGGDVSAMGNSPRICTSK